MCYPALVNINDCVLCDIDEGINIKRAEKTYCIILFSLTDAGCIQFLFDLLLWHEFFRHFFAVYANF